RRLDAGLDALLLQEVLEGQAVHDRAEHAHVVGPGAVHAAPLELRPAEAVAAADDDRDLDAAAHHVGDLAGDPVHHLGVDADPSPAEHLTGELEQDALVRRHGRSFLWTCEKAGPWRRCVRTDRPPRMTRRSDNPSRSSLTDLETGEALHAHAGLVQDRLDRLLG